MLTPLPPIADELDSPRNTTTAQGREDRLSLLSLARLSAFRARSCLLHPATDFH